MVRNCNFVLVGCKNSEDSKDLIEGPVSTMKTNESTGDLVFSPKPLSYQMCLISDSCADIFRRSFYSILFFDIC